MKVGRNDPCPCGSGKKYKHCCLNNSSSTSGHTQAGFSSYEHMDEKLVEYSRYCEDLSEGAHIPSFMEYIGRENAATQVHRELQQEISNRSFSSKEELEVFLTQFQSHQASSQLRDFEGLTSEQMHTMIYSDFEESADILALSTTVPTEQAARTPIIQQLRFVLEYHQLNEGSIKLTATGNLPRAMCQQYWETFIPESHRKHQPKVNGQNEIPELYVLREILKISKYTMTAKGQSRLTSKGASLLAKQDWGVFYRQVFLILMDQISWVKAWMPYVNVESFDIIQDSAPFQFWLLCNHPEGTVADFYERFCRAFPAYVGQIEEDYSDFPVDFSRSIYERLYFKQICQKLGLIELLGPFDEYDSLTPESRYQTTKFFSQIILNPHPRVS